MLEILYISATLVIRCTASLKQYLWHWDAALLIYTLAQHDKYGAKDTFVKAYLIHPCSMPHVSLWVLLFNKYPIKYVSNKCTMAHVNPSCWQKYWKLGLASWTWIGKLHTSHYHQCWQCLFSTKVHTIGWEIFMVENICRCTVTMKKIIAILYPCTSHVA